MSEEKDKHTDVETLFKAKTSTFFNTNLDILKADSTRPEFVPNNVAPSRIVLPTSNTHKIDQKHMTTNERGHLDFFNSTFAEQFDFKITSNGTVITGSLEKTSGGDLTMQFDNEYPTLDCTPAKTVTMTAGTDTTPVLRFYYILQSAPTIITEALSWPSAEHIKVARINVPSALFIQTKNVYSNQNINNMNKFVAGDLSGMLVHLGHKIRESIGATYESGLAGAAGGGEYLDVSGGTTVRFKMDAGVIMQMHDHAFNAVDTSVSSLVLVRNFSGTNWNDISNIYDIVNDSVGGTINNKYFNLVCIAIASKETDYVMINTPGGSYNTLANATEDKDKLDDYTIPLEFKGVATLICRMTIRKAASAWVVHQIDDLRGITPASISGSTISGGYSDVDAIVAVEGEATLLLSDGLGVGVAATSRDNLHLIGDEDQGLLIQRLSITATDNTGIRFKIDTDTGATVIKGGIFYERKFSWGRGYMHFGIENTGDATNVTLADAILTLLNGGDAMFINKLGIGMVPTTDLELTNDSAQKPTTSTWAITSDEAIKQNIQDYTLGLAALMNIRPRTFDYKPIYDIDKSHDMTKSHVGLIAQEIELVVPSTVKMGKRNHNFRQVDTGLIDEKTKEPILEEVFDTVDLKTFNSNDLTYVMINAIKELKQENDDMRVRLIKLEGVK